MRRVIVVFMGLFYGCAPVEVGAPVLTGELKAPPPQPVVIDSEFGHKLWWAIVDVVPCDKLAIVAYVQGMFESGGGTSYIYRVGNNTFGIKYWGDGPHIKAVDDWGRVYKFKKYHSLEDSVRDWYYLVTGPRYGLDCSMEVPAMFKRLKERGYATDPRYVSKLGSVLKRYVNEDVYKRG